MHRSRRYQAGIGNPFARAKFVAADFLKRHGLCPNRLRHSGEQSGKQAGRKHQGKRAPAPPPG